ncbi:PadR family transcriptional regulator [Streptacidiphilus jiangxiensis]|uniref:DNA-binding transcriptional regulator, PadR family n=1 Tax=Streptacidiphilus jiangxiensis TaxID=235985 RepID=A0A1H7L573_STRJI|nr:PadR family transcriptional regulator [Streptacidiphilus jiangxiensis]SEK94142.1 DNA-binding transcriptional regulator, PadR family [Streptacidiphilus jiangxiensis]
MTSDPLPVEPLPATAWAVLGLLSFGRELTGYELKKWAELTLAHFFWSPSSAELYAELRHLERSGHVAVDTLPGELGARRRYRLTPSGEDALRRRLAHTPLPPVDPPPAFHLWLGHLHDPARLRELLRAARALADKRAAQAETDALALADSPELTHAARALRLAARAHADERDRLDAALDDLEA